MEPSIFQGAVQAAVKTWNATGLVRFELVEAATEFDVLCAWRRTAHEDCPSFGQDSSVAHASSRAGASFVHFDAGRDWSPQATQPLPLAQVALHELGHVLGLGHSNDPQAVMFPNYDERRNLPNRSDLAGLSSLYGGEPSAHGDLIATEEGSLPSPLLFAVAPEDRTGFGLVDVNRNGRDELLVWRTDQEGNGALMLYFYDEEQRLIETKGPMLNCVLPGYQVRLGRNAQGRGLLISIGPGGTYSARQFQDRPFPPLLPSGTPFQLQSGLGDVDGDGRLDPWPPEPETNLEPKHQTGDLDGDGLKETISRRTS